MLNYINYNFGFYDYIKTYKLYNKRVCFENELELYAAKQDEIFTPEVVESLKKQVC